MVEDLARQLIAESVAGRVSDLYLIPKGGQYAFYQRQMEERRLVATYETAVMAAVISHFKYMAGMNVGEKRRSQLGACDYDYGGGQIALRLSTVGDYQGVESLVIRLIFEADNQLRFWFEGDQAVLPYIGQRGLYLFSGPVGSGKTTLMHYLARQKFDQQQVMTIEDPVEIKQADFLQLQLNEAIGATYDNLIKLSLRHRPDLLIIGEIRDSQTARAVIRAALTGATVFSTLHAKSIPGVYARLLELGVSREELEHALMGVTYQRLIAKGGVIDFAKNGFERHAPDHWNSQLDRLCAEGQITSRQAAREKIAPGQTT